MAVGVVAAVAVEVATGAEVEAQAVLPAVQAGAFAVEVRTRVDQVVVVDRS